MDPMTTKKIQLLYHLTIKMDTKQVTMNVVCCDHGRLMEKHSHLEGLVSCCCTDSHFPFGELQLRSDYVKLMALATLGTHTLMNMQKKKQFLNIIPLGNNRQCQVLHLVFPLGTLPNLEKAISTFTIILFRVLTNEISRLRTKLTKL